MNSLFFRDKLSKAAKVKFNKDKQKHQNLKANKTKDSKDKNYARIHLLK